MYMKSLVLKGFKSFADRSVLNMEPGMVCVVGPNGSGKSNISDAILWVLGERSPKNLRGTAMEDVIFAGSKNRKPVNVAEVTIVLDNSDGQIPLEFTEIELTRRMYRTGGSDYLINGSPARLLDFLDLLHDTGLGTGTHSIISQGNLEGILQSRPEDRRALIEEAAGILKHKQRKEQSARKLAIMDQHLVRVQDIFGEVTRQMGPLERKAKRALAYRELTEEYAQWRLRLAVDDLRVLQEKWHVVEEAKTSYETTCADLKAQLDEAEARLDELSAQLEAESRDREIALQKRARLLAVSNQLESCVALLKQREAGIETRIAEEQTVSSGLEAELARLREELARLDEARTNAEAKVTEAQTVRNEAATAHEEAQAKLQEAQKESYALSAAKRKAEDEYASLQRRISVARTDFDSDEHHLVFVQERITEEQNRLAQMVTLRNEAQAAVNDAAAALEQVQAEDAAITARIQQLRAQATETEQLRTQRADVVAQLEAEAKALVEIERASKRAAGSARAWLMSEESPLFGAVSELASELLVDEGFDKAVEAALGDAISALAVFETEELAEIGSVLDEKQLSGKVELALSGTPATDARGCTEAMGAVALADKVHGLPKMQGVIAGLLGDVLVVDSLAQAQHLASAATQPLRFVTPAGELVSTTGLVKLPGEADELGVLERRRRSVECASELEQAKAQLAASLDKLQLVGAATEEARKSSADAARRVAMAQGELASAKKALAEAENKHRSAQVDLEAYEKLAGTLQSKREQAMPLIADLEAELQAAEKAITVHGEGLTRAESALEGLRTQANKASQSFSEAVSTLNAAQSAFALAKSRYFDRVATEKDLLARLDNSKVLRGKKVIARRRLAEVQTAIDRLSFSLSALPYAAVLTASADEEGVVSTVADKTNSARLQVRELRAQYDEASTRFADNRVQSAELKMQVQSAIDVITTECKTSIEAALATPPLEDRAQAQERADFLKRRITNLGSVNPDAADEFEAVKKRYDFLSAQLDDLQEARGALKKIDVAIDERMRTAFADTFALVNANFQEVFSVLFPGGSAELILTDPEDLANTGVEVVAQPRGKKITRMMLMSGGEKSLVALALLFAVYRIRTTPFYVLDEVEAALDDTNLRRLLAYLEQLRENTQLIMITHQRRTMEMADLLFGVSMQNDGVTKVISQRLERALAYAED